MLLQEVAPENESPWIMQRSTETATGAASSPTRQATFRSERRRLTGSGRGSSESVEREPCANPLLTSVQVSQIPDHRAFFVLRHAVFCGVLRPEPIHLQQQMQWSKAVSDGDGDGR